MWGVGEENCVYACVYACVCVSIDIIPYGSVRYNIYGVSEYMHVCRLMRRRIKVADSRIFLVSAAYMHIREEVVDDNNRISKTASQANPPLCLPRGNTKRQGFLMVFRRCGGSERKTVYMHVYMRVYVCICVCMCKHRYYTLRFRKVKYLWCK